MASEAPITVHLATAPTYEFILSLCVWSDVDEHAAFDVGPEWFAATRNQAPRELQTAITRFAQGSDTVWARLLTFIPPDADALDAPGFIALLEAQDPVEVHLRIIGAGSRACEQAIPAEIIAAAITGDPTARRALLRASNPDDARWQSALRYLLAQPSPALHAELIAILRGWHDAVWRGKAETAVDPIACEAANRRAWLAQTAPLAALRTVANGFEYIPEAGIERVVLVPSVVIRPQIYYVDYATTKWLCVPVADDCLARDPFTPPPKLVRVLRALGDERRLRILRLLATGAFTLGQIAAQFGLGKTLAHHHLTILRGAGLILVRNGNPMVYTLRYDTLDQVGPLLDTFLTPGE